MRFCLKETKNELEITDRKIKIKDFSVDVVLINKKVLCQQIKIYKTKHICSRGCVVSFVLSLSVYS